MVLVAFLPHTYIYIYIFSLCVYIYIYVHVYWLNLVVVHGCAEITTCRLLTRDLPIDLPTCLPTYLPTYLYLEWEIISGDVFPLELLRS